MKKSLDSELIQEIATELGVHPSFVEKDWYAVQILSLLARNQIEDICLVFAGGTSLSKGYGIIKRFSEDLDFRFTSTSAMPRTRLSRFKNGLIELIKGEDDFEIDTKTKQTFDGGKMFSFLIGYPQNHALDGSLRENLKLEMRMQDCVLPTENRKISSFVNAFLENEHETETICISPTETAADKFSALLWRIIARDRNEPLDSTKNDPTMIRHLHDLCALEAYAGEPEFAEIIHHSFASDVNCHAKVPHLGWDLHLKLPHLIC